MKRERKHGKHVRRIEALAFFLLFFAFQPAAAGDASLSPSCDGLGDGHLTLATTTSLENSGLLPLLADAFLEETGVTLRAIVTGTGTALQIGARGDADAVLVHHPPSEQAFLEAGYGVRRLSLMYNHFILIGPADDPCALRSATSLADAMTRFARGCGVFLSRGDNSGTHAAEHSLWREVGMEEPGAWYLEAGGGMGATLNIAATLNAYTLSDTATWESFENRGRLEALYEGRDLRNPYSLLLIHPERHPHIKADAGTCFASWLTLPTTHARIRGFRPRGRQIFFSLPSP